jgi:hypothetical protein
MGLYLEGRLTSARVLKEADKGGKGGFYAFGLRDHDGREYEVLSGDQLGRQGEQIRVPVNAEAEKDNRTKEFSGRVKFYTVRQQREGEIPDWFTAPVERSSSSAPVAPSGSQTLNGTDKLAGVK